MPILSVTEPEGGEAESNKSKYSTVQDSTFFGRHSPFIGHCQVERCMCDRPSPGCLTAAAARLSTVNSTS